MTKRLQNKIAESRWALPVTTLYAILVCIAGGLFSERLWPQFAMLTLSTLMMVELNNANALIRIYSRMVSCSFLVMTVMSLFLFRSVTTGIVQLSTIAALLLLLRAYQNQNATGWVFYAFFAIGVASIVFVQILFFVPVLWILLAINLLAFSPRTLASSVLGLATPYWFVTAYYAYTSNLQALADHFIGLIQFGSPFAFHALDSHRLVTLAFILLLAIAGSAHFLLFSYQDKIRTRMLYEMFITLNACCLIFLLLQPQHFDYLLGLMIILTATLIGHFIALTHSRLSNIFFCFITFTALLITLYNLWQPSTTF